MRTSSLQMRFKFRRSLTEKPVGRLNVSLSTLKEEGEIEQWYPLDPLIRREPLTLEELRGGVKFISKQRTLESLGSVRVRFKYTVRKSFADHQEEIVLPSS